MSPHLRAWLWAFLFTQAVEVPIWACALRRWRVVTPGKPPWPAWVCAVVGFGASAITHPFVWFWFPRAHPGAVGFVWLFFPAAAPRGYLPMVLEAEAFAVVVEAMYADAFRLRYAFAWSLAANAASAGLGLASRAAFGWP